MISPELSDKGDIENNNDDEFILSEIFYVACLETLLNAYIIPLSNIIEFPSKKCRNSKYFCIDHNALLRSFGADILELLSCHKSLINSLQVYNCFNNKRENEYFDHIKGENFKNNIDNDLSLLCKVLPALRVAYQRYVSNFPLNSNQARLAMKVVPYNLWNNSYFNLAHNILKKYLLDLGINNEGATLLTEYGNISFDALIVLPMKHIARYPIYIENLIENQYNKDNSNNNNNMILKVDIEKAQEVLKEFQCLCASVNKTRVTLLHFQKLSELKKVLGLNKQISSQFINEGDVVMTLGSIKESGCIEKCCYKGRLILLSDYIIILVYENNNKKVIKCIKKILLDSVLSVRRINNFNIYISYTTKSNWHQWAYRKRVGSLFVIVANEMEAILWVRDIAQAVSDLNIKEQVFVH